MNGSMYVNRVETLVRRGVQSVGDCAEGGVSVTNRFAVRHKPRGAGGGRRIMRIPSCFSYMRAARTGGAGVRSPRIRADKSLVRGGVVAEVARLPCTRPRRVGAWSVVRAVILVPPSGESALRRLPNGALRVTNL